MQNTLYIMMFYLAAVLCSVMAGGCSQNTKWPSQPSPSQPSAQPSNTLAEKYNEYLLIMDDTQRAQFFKLESDAERERFLQA
jgi:hypothetical protein